MFDIAVAHADKTMKYHFRPDYTSYHVAVYDTLTGEFIKGVTHQGYSDDSMWLVVRHGLSMVLQSFIGKQKMSVTSILYKGNGCISENLPKTMFLIGILMLRNYPQVNRKMHRLLP